MGATHETTRFHIACWCCITTRHARAATGPSSRRRRADGLCGERPNCSNDELAKLGVARISYGALPYIRAMSDLQQEAMKAFPRRKARRCGRLSIRLCRLGLSGCFHHGSQTFLGACRQDADASKAAIRVAVGEPNFVRWATRFRVAPLQPTNPETVGPRAFVGPRLSRRHSTRIARASSPSAPLPDAVREARH